MNYGCKCWLLERTKELIQFVISIYVWAMLNTLYNGFRTSSNLSKEKKILKNGFSLCPNTLFE